MKAQGHKLELVIIDYLQLLSPDTKGRSNYEAVSVVSRNLKQISGVLVAATYGRSVFQFVRPTGPALAVNPQQ